MGILHARKVTLLRLFLFSIVFVGIESIKGELIQARRPRDLQTSTNHQFNMNMLPRLGIQMLQDGRIRFGTKTLKGVRLPENPSAQIRIMEKLLNWYWPCFQSKQEGYELDTGCFAEQEDEYLKHLAKTVSNLRFKYIL